jgi:hypothetical protein
MRRGAAEIVEVRLGLAHRKMTIGFMGSGDVAIENLPIVETMTVNLYGSPGAFKIERQSRATQLVTGSLIGASLDHDRFGRWLWHVTPKMIGTHDLTIKVSADLSDSGNRRRYGSCRRVHAPCVVAKGQSVAERRGLVELALFEQPPPLPVRRSTQSRDGPEL